MLLDIVIIASSLICLPYLGRNCYCYLWFHNVCRIEFYADMFFSGSKQSVQFSYFKQYDAIADRITEKRAAGTVLNSRGWYTKEEGKVAVVIVRKNNRAIFFVSSRRLKTAFLCSLWVFTARVLSKSRNSFRFIKNAFYPISTLSLRL